MTVYVVLYEEMDCGAKILGIYSSVEAAQAAHEPPSDGGWSETGNGMYYMDGLAYGVDMTIEPHVLAE